MHILIIPSWYPKNKADINGSFFREQSIALERGGNKVGVIYPDLRSLRDWRSVWSGRYDIAREDDEGVVTYRAHGMNWFPRNAGLAEKLYQWHGGRLYKKYVDENGVPDVMHAHSLLYAGSIAALHREKFGVKFVVTEHSSAFARKLISKKGVEIAKKSALAASRRFAVSQSLASALDDLIGNKAGEWEEFPNIVQKKFLNYEFVEKIKRPRIRFLNVAHLNKNKGHVNLLEAFSLAMKSAPNIILTIGGDGPERKNLENLARDLGIAQSVKFTGLLSRDEVLLEMVKADALVLASKYETFGVVAIEALALGKPVISTRCGGPESIIRPEDGVLVPVDDPSALAAAILRMSESEELYDEVEIRSSCAIRFGEKSIVNRLAEAYAGLINKK